MREEIAHVVVGLGVLRHARLQRDVRDATTGIVVRVGRRDVFHNGKLLTLRKANDLGKPHGMEARDQLVAREVRDAPAARGVVVPQVVIGHQEHANVDGGVRHERVDGDCGQVLVALCGKDVCDLGPGVLRAKHKRYLRLVDEVVVAVVVVIVKAVGREVNLEVRRSDDGVVVVAEPEVSGMVALCIRDAPVRCLAGLRGIGVREVLLQPVVGAPAVLHEPGAVLQVRHVVLLGLELVVVEVVIPTNDADRMRVRDVVHRVAVLRPVRGVEVAGLRRLARKRGVGLVADGDGAVLDERLLDELDGVLVQALVDHVLLLVQLENGGVGQIVDSLDVGDRRLGALGQTPDELAELPEVLVRLRHAERPVGVVRLVGHGLPRGIHRLGHGTPAATAQAVRIGVPGKRVLDVVAVRLEGIAQPRKLKLREVNPVLYVGEIWRLVERRVVCHALLARHRLEDRALERGRSAERPAAAKGRLVLDRGRLTDVVEVVRLDLVDVDADVEVVGTLVVAVRDELRAARHLETAVVAAREVTVKVEHAVRLDPVLVGRPIRIVSLAVTVEVQDDRGAGLVEANRLREGLHRRVVQRGALGIRCAGLLGLGVRLLCVGRSCIALCARGFIMCCVHGLSLRYGRIHLFGSGIHRRCHLLRRRRLPCRRRICLRRGRLCGRTGFGTGVGNRL